MFQNFLTVTLVQKQSSSFYNYLFFNMWILYTMEKTGLYFGVKKDQKLANDMTNMVKESDKDQKERKCVCVREREGKREIL